MDPTALGRYLRESREAKELTLEDAVRSLHIRREVFESFEQGNFDVADSPVRIRGMLRNYARFIGLEEERVLQYYEAAQDEKRRIRRRFGRRKDRTEPIAPRSITDTPPSLPVVTVGARRGFNFGGFLRNIFVMIALTLVSVAALFVIAYVIYNMLDLRSLLNNATEVPAIIDDSGTSTPTNTPSITPMTLEASSTPNGISRGILDVQVELDMTQRSYVRILTDGTETFAGILTPGESMQLEGSESVEIVAESAAALHIIYNGEEQELFGGRGQEVDLVFSMNGVEVSLGEGGALSTGSPTPVDLIQPTSFLAEATAEITVSASSIEPSPTAFLAVESAPTSFLAVPDVPSATESQTSAFVTQAIQTTATTIPDTPTATVTSSPTATSTSLALLPPRETTQPTPTKP